MRPIRVVVVDDALFVREALVRLLADEKRISIVGTAGSGEELMDNVARWRPDVITLDLSMPGMGGMATLDRVMMTRPTPVIILSASTAEGAPLTIEALARGAADFIDKGAYSLMDFQSLRRVLLEKILEIVGHGLPTALPTRTPTSIAQGGAGPNDRPGHSAFDVLVVGASTGGPRAIEYMLRSLGAVSVPIVMVQHMPAGFTEAFAERLDRCMPMRVREASEGDRLMPETVYVAAAGLHLRLERSNEDLYATIGESPADVAHRPSVDVLFASAREAAGDRTLAVLLTGMGRDGAAGMEELHRAGAYTIAQDEASCVVYGMPRAAVEANAVRETVSLDRMGARLQALLAGGEEKERE